METKFQILKISKQKSYHTKKDVYAVFFKGSDGGSYKTWLDPLNGNYRRWQSLLKVGNTLTGIRVKQGRLIDADSFPTLVREQTIEEEQ